ncbi:unnamed protein product [Calypogeia fissa]
MATKSCFDRMCGARSSVVTSAIKIVGFILVCLLCVPWLFEDSEMLQRFMTSYVTPRDLQFLPEPTNELRTHRYAPVSTPMSTPNDRPMLKLIRDIREAVKVAAGGSDVSLSDEDRQAWEEKFPCRSRVELEKFYEKRNHIQYVPLNKQWQEVLAEYAILHRVCMQRVGNLKDYFMSRNDSTGCKFLIAEAHYGLGNKVLHMSSLVMYAVLTQRVVLIPTSTSVPPIMCEPFPGSSWSMDDDLHGVTKTYRQNSNQLYSAIDQHMAGKESLSIHAAQGGGIWGPEIRFWCNTEQMMFDKVMWLTFDGCLHSLPKLFAIAKFRPILEDIFPKKTVLTHVLRTVMLPADPVWERIANVHTVHLDNAEKQVGVQVRFLHGENQYKQDNFPVNGHITQCLLEEGFLPEVCPENATLVAEDGRFVNCSSSTIDTDPPPPVTKVLIASLFLGFHDYLQNVYLRHETVDRETVAVVQLTHEKTQGTGVDVDSQALVEIIALSLSDVLLVTPFSTFGGLAQGYGTLVPYFIEYNVTESVPCQRGLTTEPCYLGAIPHYDCHYDDPPNGSYVVDVVPYLQRCMHIDVGPGYAMLMMN